MQLYSNALVDDGEAVPAFDEIIEVVLQVTNDELWVITHTEPSALWRVSRRADRPNRLMAQLPDRWVTSMLSLAVSPDGRYAALGATPREHFFDRREYAVLRLGLDSEPAWTPAAGLVRVFGIPGTNNVRTLEPIWIDTHCIRWDGGLEEDAVDARTGMRFKWDGEDRGFVQSKPEWPFDSAREQVGGFVRLGDRIEVLPQASEVVRVVATRTSDYHAFEWSVSPDGMWMASERRAIDLVSAASGAERRAFLGWCVDARWLPPVAKAEAPQEVHDSGELHAALGRDVVVRGLAMHGPDGPYLRTAEGRALYLADHLVHAPNSLGRECTATGRLLQRSAVDLQEALRPWSWSRFGGVYVLLDAVVVADELPESR
jgi:hypothetical protein